MKLSAAIAFAMVLAPSAVSAQINALDLGMALCRAVKDDAKRLQCFDTITDPKNREKPPAPRGPDPMAGRPVIQENPTWETVESKSPIDDSPQFDALLRSSDRSGVLMLRCKEKKTEAAIMPQGFVGLAISGGGMRVQYRIGSESVREARWGPSSNGRAVFAPSPIPFVRALKDNETLFVRIFDFQGVPHDASFSLGNVSTVRTRIAQTCGWSQK